MLTIKDLTASKELDSKAMAGVAGGYSMGAYGIPSFVLNLASPINAPKQAGLSGFSSSYTGIQSNTNMQSDNDFTSVIGSGQGITTGGNHNATSQNAFSTSNNFGSITQ